MELFFVIQSNDVIEKVFEIMNNDLDKAKTLLYSKFWVGESESLIHWVDNI